MRLIKILQLSLCTFVMCWLSNQLSAAHIVGGDANYTFIRYNATGTQITYRVEFWMYRDKFSGGAPFDSPTSPNSAGANFGIYKQEADNSWTFVEAKSNLDHLAVTDIPGINDPCVDEPSNVGVQKTSYVFEVTLDVINTSYLITYQRCCRNNTINNIRDPSTTGAVFDIEITAAAQRLGNSSPTFNNFPPIFICADKDVNFDHSASDKDPEGDILRYSFCAPFSAGGTMGGPNDPCNDPTPTPADCPPDYENVSFLPPFTSTAPLAGDPVVSIDEVTGLISGTPEITGQFVVGVCVQETSNGELLSIIRRDFQFNVLTCTPNVFAQLVAEEMDGTFLIESCGEKEVEIENLSFQQNEIFEYHWTVFNQDGTVLEDIVGGQSSRDVVINFPSQGDYSGLMILNEGSVCSDTANFQVTINPPISADFSFSYDSCVADVVTFDDLSFSQATGGIVEWEWNFGDGNMSTEKNPEHLYQDPDVYNVILTVKDENDCESTQALTLEYTPAPETLIVEPSAFLGCSPADIVFNNLSFPINDSYEVFWDFGDGNTSNEISPTHKYLEPGTYDVFLSITSPLNCTTDREFNALITVLEGPVANFDCSPDDPNIFQNTVQFMDLSENAAAWQWDFDGISNSFIQNPTYAFPDTGKYTVKLTVFHPLTSCPDTMTKIIDVEPVVIYYLPNAFTPNNDASNDLFEGKGYFLGLHNFNLSVWNRWGEKVFETDDPRGAWNGQKNNIGALSPQGVYVYQLSFTAPSGEKERRDGHVTLLR